MQLTPMRCAPRYKPQPVTNPSSEVYDDGCLHVEFEHHYITCAGKRLVLANIEFLILSLLLRHVEVFVPASVIWQYAWKTDAAINVNTLRVRIRLLRERLEPLHLFIESEPNIGYRLTLRSCCRAGNEPVLIGGIVRRKPRGN